MWNDHRTTLLTISSAVLAVAPKCPICFLAYFGIFGVATASASAYRTWLPPITGFWLALTIAMLALRTDRKRRHVPMALGLVAGISVFAGKFIVESQVLLDAGIGVLIIAAGWSAWSRISAERSPCSQCEPQTRLTEPSPQAGS